jgi:hypothetical protein
MCTCAKCPSNSLLTPNVSHLSLCSSVILRSPRKREILATIDRKPNMHGIKDIRIRIRRASCLLLLRRICSLVHVAAVGAIRRVSDPIASPIIIWLANCLQR